jgi:hypothetical protein
MHELASSRRVRRVFRNFFCVSCAWQLREGRLTTAMSAVDATQYTKNGILGYLMQPHWA